MFFSQIGYDTVARWGYFPKSDCEFIYIRQGNVKNPTKFKLSRYAAEELQEELGRFLDAYDQEAAGRRGQFIILSRFRDTAKLLAPFAKETYFNNPDFVVDDGGIKGRYQGDRAVRKYKLHLKIPVDNSGIENWTGPHLELNTAEMKALLSYIHSAIEEMDLKCTE